MDTQLCSYMLKHIQAQMHLYNRSLARCAKELGTTALSFHETCQRVKQVQLRAQMRWIRAARGRSHGISEVLVRCMFDEASRPLGESWFARS